jgi:hypothetical protein
MQPIHIKAWFATITKTVSVLFSISSNLNKKYSRFGQGAPSLPFMMVMVEPYVLTFSETNYIN